VVVLVHETARAKGSGLDMDMRIAHVWTLREGRAVALQAYVDRAEALAALGAT
jgi:ketosteroid isomerase-like protein